MNKQEQSELCRLLAKMRYDIMKEMFSFDMTKEVSKNLNELLTSINRIMGYSYIDMSKKGSDKE